MAKKYKIGEFVVERDLDEIKKPFEKGCITLKLPISIRRTAIDDGYVITDADKVEHFFYGILVYDGNCRPVTRIPKPKSAKKKTAKK